MSASVFDSPLYAPLFPVGDAGRLFTDSAALRAMLLVEGALAKVQGDLGVIPKLSAAALHRASLEIAIDPGAIAKTTGQNGVPVPALITAFRTEMNAPEHAQFAHWGATSQDIIDTGLMLRLRQLLTLIEADIRLILTALAEQATDQPHLIMAARTYGQNATPTSWGAVMAEWGAPLLDLLAALPQLRKTCLLVSLSGAAGTASALPQATQTRAALALALGLADPKRSWHTDRTPVLRIADWLGHVTASMGHISQSLLALTQSDTSEVTLGKAGASSTMPQKQNPVAPSAVVALHHQFTALRSGLQSASTHQHQRDGAAWFTEWLMLPQLCLSAAAASQITAKMIPIITPDPTRMARTFTNDAGMMQAEALSFALARQMPRPKAQSETKRLCALARETGQTLAQVTQTAYPTLTPDLSDPATLLGQAPRDAQNFVDRVKAL